MKKLLFRRSSASLGKQKKQYLACFRQPTINRHHLGANQKAIEFHRRSVSFFPTKQPQPISALHFRKGFQNVAKTSRGITSINYFNNFKHTSSRSAPNSWALKPAFLSKNQLRVFSSIVEKEEDPKQGKNTKSHSIDDQKKEEFFSKAEQVENQRESIEREGDTTQTQNEEQGAPSSAHQTGTSHEQFDDEAQIEEARRRFEKLEHKFQNPELEIDGVPFGWRHPPHTPPWLFYYWERPDLLPIEQYAKWDALKMQRNVTAETLRMKHNRARARMQEADFINHHVFEPIQYNIENPREILRENDPYAVFDPRGFSTSLRERLRNLLNRPKHNFQETLRAFHADDPEEDLLAAYPEYRSYLGGLITFKNPHRTWLQEELRNRQRVKREREETRQKNQEYFKSIQSKQYDTAELKATTPVLRYSMHHDDERKKEYEAYRHIKGAAVYTNTMRNKYYRLPGDHWVKHIRQREHTVNHQWTDYDWEWSVLNPYNMYASGLYLNDPTLWGNHVKDGEETWNNPMRPARVKPPNGALPYRIKHVYNEKLLKNLERLKEMLPYLTHKTQQNREKLMHEIDTIMYQMNKNKESGENKDPAGKTAADLPLLTEPPKYQYDLDSPEGRQGTIAEQLETSLRNQNKDNMLSPLQEDVLNEIANKHRLLQMKDRVLKAQQEEEERDQNQDNYLARVFARDDLSHYYWWRWGEWGTFFSWLKKLLALLLVLWYFDQFHFPVLPFIHVDEYQLKGLLRSYGGYREYPVKCDGNGQFRAISMQLFGTEDNHQAIRMRAVEWLARNGDTFIDKEQTVRVRDFVHAPYLNWDDYCKLLYQFGEPGNHLTLVGIANTYQTNVVVFSTYYASGNPVTLIEPINGADKTIYLTYWAREREYGSVHVNFKWNSEIDPYPANKPTMNPLTN